MTTLFLKQPKSGLEREIKLPKTAPTMRALKLKGAKTDAGEQIYSYGFTYRCKCGNEQQVMAVAPAGAPDSQVEDMLNSIFEKVINEEYEVHQRQNKLPNDVSTWPKSLRLDVAEELRHIHNWLKRRKWSRQTLWTGVSLPSK